MTVQQLLRSLDSAEISEWQAFFALASEKDQPVEDEAAAWKKAFNAYG